MTEFAGAATEGIELASLASSVAGAASAAGFLPAPGGAPTSALSAAAAMPSAAAAIPSAAAAIPSAAAAMPALSIPASAYAVLILVLAIIVIAAILLSISASAISNIKDYDDKTDKYPELQKAHKLASWGASIGFIGAAVVITILVLIAIFASAFLLKSKAIIWMLAGLAVLIALACGIFAVLASIYLIDSGAYDPSDPEAKKGYHYSIYASLTAFAATALVVGFVVWITTRKPKAAPCAQAAPAPPTIIEYSD